MWWRMRLLRICDVARDAVKLLDLPVNDGRSAKVLPNFSPGNANAA